MKKKKLIKVCNRAESIILALACIMAVGEFGSLLIGEKALATVFMWASLGSVGAELMLCRFRKEVRTYYDRNR